MGHVGAMPDSDTYLSMLRAHAGACDVPGAPVIVVVVVVVVVVITINIIIIITTTIIIIAIITIIIITISAIFSAILLTGYL